MSTTHGMPGATTAGAQTIAPRTPGAREQTIDTGRVAVRVAAPGDDAGACGHGVSQDELSALLAAVDEGTANGVAEPARAEAAPGDRRRTPGDRAVSLHERVAGELADISARLAELSKQLQTQCGSSSGTTATSPINVTA